MAQRLRCPLGHQWDAPARGEAATDVYAPTCPQCGAKPLEPSTAVSATPPRGVEPPVAGRHRLFWGIALCAVLGGIALLIAVPFVFLNPRSARLNYSKDVTVQGLGSQQLYWDEPLVEKATVKIKSPGVQVNAYLVLQSNLDAALRALEVDKAPKEVLASAEKTEEKTFEIAPGRKPFALILTSTGKRAEVSVKVSGR
jgi:hypothetical protein